MGVRPYECVCSGSGGGGGAGGGGERGGEVRARTGLVAQVPAPLWPVVYGTVYRLICTVRTMFMPYTLVRSYLEVTVYEVQGVQVSHCLGASAARHTQRMWRYRTGAAADRLKDRLSSLGACVSPRDRRYSRSAARTGTDSGASATGPPRRRAAPSSPRAAGKAGGPLQAARERPGRQAGAVFVLRRQKRCTGPSRCTAPCCSPHAPGNPSPPPTGAARARPPSFLPTGSHPRHTREGPQR